MKYELLPHQFEAIQAIQKSFSDRNNQNCGIVSIPTGGGKTYTAVYWLNEILHSHEVKIIWFAQSFELLNQAYYCMKDNLSQELSIRRVSSEKEHCKIKDIKKTDDIILITTQSAIKNAESENAYSSFVNGNFENLICVLDEAHHAPAYGFRKMIMELKEAAPKLWLLGLTATPTYTNESRRGWLWEIFDKGVIYEVEKELLQQQGILAKENFRYIKTPTKITLNEEDYFWLVKKHLEIPEHIIEELAENKERNEFIIFEYLNNKMKYGKTIIFLDRWYQCEYMKAEFQKHGVRCDTIYSFDNGRDKTNGEVIEEFKKDEFDVLLNVKMLTEGADIPTVKTVFISHETQSYILFNQMIGRCLRGERAGGKKKEANIVLFGDKWDKSIAWYIPSVPGEISEERIERTNHPIYTFPLTMLMELNKALSKGNKFIEDYAEYVPDGWYTVKYVEFMYDEYDTIKLIEDYANALQKDKKKYDALIQYILDNKDILLEEWKKENFDERKVQEQLHELSLIFDLGCTINENSDNLVKIIRHIAQNGEEPSYVKANLNLDDAMERILVLIRNEIPEKQISILNREYSRAGSLWPKLYESFYYFKVAVDLNMTKKLLSGAKESYVAGDDTDDKEYEAVDAKSLVSAVKLRDVCCKCCGIDGKKNKLYAEPINLALGYSSIRNLQTLCSRCRKLIQNVDFSNDLTMLTEPQKFKGIQVDKSDISSVAKAKAALRGSINIMYQCGAIFDIRFVVQTDSKYCEITIFKGNPIFWIENQQDEVLHYITQDLKQKKVTDIVYKVIE